MKRLFYILPILFLSKISTGQDKSFSARHDTSFYFTTSDGVKLFVHTAGKGKPCLFVHGGPGLTSYIFEVTPAAKMIEQKVHMVYFDQRGSGRSSSAKDYSMKRMERDLEELRTFLKIQRWSVMGHSFAGLILTAYGRDYPEKIDALVYVHCTLNMQVSLKSHIENGMRLLREAGDSYQPDPQKTKFQQMMDVHGELAKKGIEYRIMFRSQREKDIEDSLIGAATPHLNQDFNHQAFILKDYAIDYGVYSKDIQNRVLIINGTKDYAVGPDSYRSWHFKNSTVVLYNGAHTSYQEEPKWFVNTVLPFLLQ